MLDVVERRELDVQSFFGMGVAEDTTDVAVAAVGRTDAGLEICEMLQSTVEDEEVLAGGSMLSTRCLMLVSWPCTVSSCVSSARTSCSAVAEEDTREFLSIVFGRTGIKRQETHSRHGRVDAKRSSHTQPGTCLPACPFFHVYASQSCTMDTINIENLYTLTETVKHKVPRPSDTAFTNVCVSLVIARASCVDDAKRLVKVLRKLSSHASTKTLVVLTPPARTAMICNQPCLCFTFCRTTDGEPVVDVAVTQDADVIAASYPADTAAWSLSALSAVAHTQTPTRWCWPTVRVRNEGTSGTSEAALALALAAYVCGAVYGMKHPDGVWWTGQVPALDALLASHVLDKLGPLPTPSELVGVPAPVAPQPAKPAPVAQKRPSKKAKITMTALSPNTAAPLVKHFNELQDMLLTVHEKYKQLQNMVLRAVDDRTQKA